MNKKLGEILDEIKNDSIDEFLQNTCSKITKSMYEECAKKGIHPDDLEWKYELLDGKMCFKSVGFKKVSSYMIKEDYR